MHVNGNDNGQTDEQKDGRTGGQIFLQGLCPEDKRFQGFYLWRQEDLVIAIGIGIGIGIGIIMFKN